MSVALFANMTTCNERVQCRSQRDGYKGKSLEENAFCLEIVQHFDSNDMFFVQVTFDGGHDEDCPFAGYGYVTEGSQHPKHPNHGCHSLCMFVRAPGFVFKHVTCLVCVT